MSLPATAAALLPTAVPAAVVQFTSSSVCSLVWLEGTYPSFLTFFILNASASCLQGIANLTVGAKLPQLLWNATKKMQPLIAQKKLRGPRRKRKKPGDSDPMDADQADADQADADTAGADKDDDSGDELFALLDKGMADLGSDAEGDDQAPPEVEGIKDDDDDDEIDVLEHVNLPALGGRGLKAAMRRADQRRQRKEQAVRSWRQFEVC